MEKEKEEKIEVLEEEKDLKENKNSKSHACDCNKDSDDSCGGECHCHEKQKKHKKEKDHKRKEDIKKLEEENKNLLEKVRLAQAELINYRKRKDEETANILKFANQDLIMEILPIVDNFERAIKLDDNDLTDELSKFLDGFKMMYASLTETLKKFGVEEINRVGQVFDPNEEQALLTDCVEEDDDEVVLEVLLKGYKYKGRVIRPASVKINQK